MKQSAPKQTKTELKEEYLRNAKKLYGYSKDSLYFPITYEQHSWLYLFHWASGIKR